ncbi:hypothetical protein WKH57_00955 [Niallia taxi]|uniref:hypothetical protein n=1 Tax=Niallia taxi TaxID=2499688 RepID=UPI00316FA4B0
MKRKDRYTVSEVMGLIEDKMILNEASTQEEELYQDYKWSGKIDYKLHSLTIKRIIRDIEIGKYI